MIQVCTPFLTGNEAKYLGDCVSQNEISSGGRFLEDFEKQFSAYCGCAHGIAAANATTALHLAVAALRIGPGDEVIIPDFTISSTAFAVIYCGAKPVFVDSEEDTWNINPDLIEAKITRKTKAIIPVHIYGHPCDMDPILKLARKYKLAVIEDAAESHGAEYKGKKVGGLGDLGVFSFYANKIITCGEGGMVVTNNSKLAERCQLLKNLAFQKKKRFFHEEIGFNYRMTNLQAALGMAQFEKIEFLIECRRRNARLYKIHLKNVPGLTMPIQKDYATNVYWMFGILVNPKQFGVNRNQLMQKLFDRGIETRTFFIPMHAQPILKKMKLLSKEQFPVCERLGQQGLYLPSGSGLKREEIEYVCDIIRKIHKEAYSATQKN